MSQAAAGTKGFLFADLRGYSAYVERSGDQAAAELLATYRDLVRTAIAAHDGAEIRTEGDSVYVVFAAASGAVEAGLGIVAAAAEASTVDQPIRVGVGVHAGETVATTEGLVGGAVNIAARVCAKAQAGEVLVTDTVRALTRTYLPYRYTSLGTQQLKGIAGGIPLYRVELTPTTRSARLRRQLSARRGRVAIVVGLAVVLLAVGAGVYAVNRGPDCLTLPATTKDVVAKIDPARNCVVATYPVGQRPDSAVLADEILWVANLDDQTLTWIDAVSGKTGATSAGGGIPIGLASGPGSVMVLDRNARLGSSAAQPYTASDQVGQISNAQKHLVDPPHALPAPGLGVRTDRSSSGYQAIAFVANRAWITNAATGQIVRLTGGGFAPTIQVESPAGSTFGAIGTGVGPIATGGGDVWVGNFQKSVLYRVEGSGTPSQISLDGDAGSVAIVAADNAIWLARSDGHLTRVSLASGSIATFDLGGNANALAAGSDAVWAADLLGSAVRRVDPQTGKVLATIAVGGRPAGVAIAADGSVWVTIQGP